MPTHEEMATWSVEDVKDQISGLLPLAWTVENAEDDGFFICTIKDGQGESKWRRALYNLRLVLLDAYGWLYTRNNVPSNPAWGRRRELTPEQVLGHASHLRSAPGPDPEDLSPDEIRSVYEKHNGHR